MSSLIGKSVARKSVPVTAEDTRAVERLREPAGAYRAAIAEILGVELSANPSEAEVLQALIEAGRIAVEEKVMTSGYTALAAARGDEDREHDRAMRNRRRGSSED
ncbi:MULTISPECIES: hypothetical protein [Kitasatospora]|uniref:Uncharacterized protein n=1 Tax=Kitasatospora setae (strain ATCC 33774 / DSM 43861 / JCM 3304 / KCC A-0304 / NBRC 14216 / KM-6054) TaxID=452652 RepID=E4NGL5_KITSK|nr:MULTISPECIES: hypothetical protein [Kitasatospora]BAJ30645.1 hypothetical protein KSE_48670 [Kitasatospora setae KM-6054]